MTVRTRVNIEEALAVPGAEVRAMRKVVAEEMVRRKRLGLSIIVWRDGKVVEVPPEEIPEDGGLAEAEAADRAAGMPWACGDR